MRCRSSPADHSLGRCFAGCLVAVYLQLMVAVSPATANPVLEENQRAGTEDWHGPVVHGRAAEAYASEMSVLPGGSLDLHVSTAPAAHYRIEVYRLGWYGGLGGRLVACLPSCGSEAQGIERPIPPEDPDTGLIEANWPVTDTLRVPPEWVSGYYLARVELTSGDHSGAAEPVPFVVREPPGRQAAMLVQLPVNTWQAYNNWGGRSLYAYNSAERRPAVKVSFDRPFGSAGTLFPNKEEFPMIRFLERHGYDVAYSTNVDTERAPGDLLARRAVMSLGHDEYWTKQNRDAFEAARDAGRNVVTIGANSAYWQSRYEDDERTLVVYRSKTEDPDPDPATKTVRFRSLDTPRPECALLGVQFTPGSPREGVHDFPVNDVALGSPWFSGTGFTAGSSATQAIYKEWDEVVPGCVSPEPTVLFHWEDGTGSRADAVRYVARSGAEVFSAGSLGFAEAVGGPLTGPCAGDYRLQVFLRNALDELAGEAALSSEAAATCDPQPSPGPIGAPPPPSDRPTAERTRRIKILNRARTARVSRSGIVRFRMQNPNGRPARGVAELRMSARLVGRRSFRIARRPSTATVPIRLNLRARRALKRQRVLRAVLILRPIGSVAGFKRGRNRVVLVIRRRS